MTFDPVSICRILNEEAVDYVVVGGFASVILGSPLPTEDVDVLPDKSPDNLGLSTPSPGRKAHPAGEMSRRRTIA
jgi:hypothetical protein